MKVCVLASGSKGNCTYIECNDTKILIDAGISKKRVETELNKINVTIDQIDALFITHEHIDHVLGIIPLYKAFKGQLYMSLGTHKALLQKDIEKYSILKPCFITATSKIAVNDLIVSSIPIFHDAAEPLGFIVLGNNQKLVYITDTGYIHKDIVSFISNADIYVFECNHDEQILMQCDRPYNTKMRILGQNGHLSNEDALYVLANIIGCNTKKVFYAHISLDCNLFEIISLTQQKVFNNLGVNCSNIEFIFTSQISTGVIEV